jgi:hypothetical protein
VVLQVSAASFAEALNLDTHTHIKDTHTPLPPLSSRMKDLHLTWGDATFKIEVSEGGSSCAYMCLHDATCVASVFGGRGRDGGSSICALLLPLTLATTTATSLQSEDPATIEYPPTSLGALSKDLWSQVDVDVEMEGGAGGAGRESKDDGGGVGGFEIEMAAVKVSPNVTVAAERWRQKRCLPLNYVCMYAS